MATESSEILLKLIDDILLFSKSDNSIIDLAQERFVLADLCISVHKSLLSLSITNKNRFELHVSADAKRAVIGDAHRLRQVLVNLIGNANKFTKKGRITLRVESLPGIGTDLVFRISVADTGIGIPKDKQKVIFNRFQTLDASYTRRTDGTGLGLAICDKLVQAMGSSIQLESDVGIGSSFSFQVKLPLSTEVVRDTKAAERKSDGAVAKSLKILLAEDNATNTYVANEMLIDAGHKVTHASNGRRAVQLSRSEDFDLILMDISMPELDGFQATAEIRSSCPRNSSIPIMALTAHTGLGDQEAFLSARMNGYVTKPFRRNVLLEAVAVHGRRSAGVLCTRNDASNTPPASSFQTIVNYTTFLEFINDRAVDRALKTLHIFVTELRQKSVSLAEIIRQENNRELQSLAHSMIGSGAMLGAGRLVELSRAIEEGAVEGSAAWATDANLLLVVLEETIHTFSKIENETTLREFIDRKLAA